MKHAKKLLYAAIYLISLGIINGVYTFADNLLIGISAGLVFFLIAINSLEE